MPGRRPSAPQPCVISSRARGLMPLDGPNAWAGFLRAFAASRMLPQLIMGKRQPLETPPLLAL